MLHDLNTFMIWMPIFEFVYTRKSISWSLLGRHIFSLTWLLDKKRARMTTKMTCILYHNIRILVGGARLHLPILCILPKIQLESHLYLEPWSICTWTRHSDHLLRPICNAVEEFKVLVHGGWWIDSHSWKNLICQLPTSTLILTGLAL